MVFVKAHKSLPQFLISTEGVAQTSMHTTLFVAAGTRSSEIESLNPVSLAPYITSVVTETVSDAGRVPGRATARLTSQKGSYPC